MNSTYAYTGIASEHPSMFTHASIIKIRRSKARMKNIL